MYRYILLLSTISLGLFPVWCAAAEKPGTLLRAWNYIKKDANVSVGVGARQFSLELRDTANQLLGKFVDSTDEAYFLSYSGRPTFLRNSHFGYRWMLNLSTFKASEQEIAPEIKQDLGTRTSGLFSYVVPTFFANFGDRYKGKYFRIGIGIGAGFSYIKGDMLLNYSANPTQRINLSNNNNINTAVGAFSELRISNFVLRINSGGPVIDMQNYKAHISSVSVMLGLSYFLD